MRLGADWPSNETEAHHLLLLVKRGQSLVRVRGSAADGESILFARAVTKVATRSRTPVVKPVSMTSITRKLKIQHSRCAKLDVNQCMLTMPLSA